MPLGTLQFTERLGYRQENALKMLTMGCYNALWALQAHLEAQKEAELDDRDRVALGLVRRWTGIAEWPEKQPDHRAIAPGMAVPAHRLRLPRRNMRPWKEASRLIAVGQLRVALRYKRVAMRLPQLGCQAGGIGAQSLVGEVLAQAGDIAAEDLVSRCGAGGVR